MGKKKQKILNIDGDANQLNIVDKGLPHDFINKNSLNSERVKASIAAKIDAYGTTAHQETKSITRKEIEDIMGKGKVISKVFDQIEKFAKTDIPILLEGETGTGKELIANYLWKNGLRKKMRTLNCSSLSPELASSELFGHSKGAFTSADSETEGLLKIIDGGILFLDEISSLPIEVQLKLLRVIEYGTFERIGDKKEFKVNVRIIAAGNQLFQNLIENGVFREDLYERFPKKIYIPTLKERIEDINYFIDHFLYTESRKYGKQVFISNEARKILSEYEWTRNVRQLKNTIANLVIEVELDKKTKTYIIQPKLVRACLQEQNSRGTYNKDFTWKTAEKEAMKSAITRALKATNGNNEEAILLLNIARGTYFIWKKKLGITK